MFFELPLWSSSQNVIIRKWVYMSFQEKLALVLLASISLFLFATQNVMNPVIQEIMKEYSVTEKDVGWIGSAFILVGACCGIVIGYWTDRSSRIHLFSAVVLVGTIPCFLNGFRLFTPSYSALLWLRIISGIGVAGIFPITFSFFSMQLHQLIQLHPLM